MHAGTCIQQRGNNLSADRCRDGRRAAEFLARDARGTPYGPDKRAGGGTQDGRVPHRAPGPPGTEDPDRGIERPRNRPAARIPAGDHHRPGRGRAGTDFHDVRRLDGGPRSRRRDPVGRREAPSPCAGDSRKRRHMRSRRGWNAHSAQGDQPARGGGACAVGNRERQAGSQIRPGQRCRLRSPLICPNGRRRETPALSDP